MALSWSVATKTITFSSSASHTTSEMVTEIANTAYAETLLARADYGTSGVSWGAVYHLNDVRVVIGAGCTWADDCCIILHTLNSADDAVEFSSSTAKIEWGYVAYDGSDALKPYTIDMATAGIANEDGIVAPVHYSFVSDNSSQTWCDGTSGILYLWGGSMRFRDDQTDGFNQTYSVILPAETEIIQAQVENYGGAKLPDTYRLQEVTFKGSENRGLDLAGDSTYGTDHNVDIKLIKNTVGLDLTGSGDADAQAIRLRGNTADLRVNGLTGTVRLINSDTISTTHATMTFGTGGEVLEVNTYTVLTVDDAGDDLASIRVLAYQKSSDGSTAYGTEQVSDANGELTNDFIVKRTLYNSTYDSYADRYSFGNMAVRLRHYDYKFMDIEKVPGEVAIRDKFILLDEEFTVATSVQAAAITGISIDEANEEIDLTAAVTIQELYDYLHYTQAQSGNLDIPELLKTKTGVSYTIPSGWTITGLSYLDMLGRTIVGRYVPVTIKAIVSGTQCGVEYNGNLIGNGLSTGTDITVAVIYTAAISVQVRARLAGYLPYVTTINLGANGNTVTANLQSDEVYA